MDILRNRSRRLGGLWNGRNGMLLSCDRGHRLSMRLRAHHHRRTLRVVLWWHPLLLRYVVLRVSLLRPSRRRVVVCVRVLVAVVRRQRRVRCMLRVGIVVAALRVHRESRRHIRRMPSLLIRVVHVQWWLEASAEARRT